MILGLFVVFFLAGLVSFGGGYAMIPFIQEEVLFRRHWMDAAQLTDIIAVAGMSPGPIAANIAAAVGYQKAGPAGAVVAVTAVVLPSFLIILAAGKLLVRHREHPLTKSAFYGLRPVITGMIAWAAFTFAQYAGMTDGAAWLALSQFLIFAGSLWALTYLHKHPFTVLILSGLVGAALYG